MKGLGASSEDVMRRLAVHAGRAGVAIDVTTNVERKALVLSYPDLAARLCEKPMCLPKPEMWSGYIAPEFVETGARNTSPYRAQAVAIYDEALARRAGGVS